MCISPLNDEGQLQESRKLATKQCCEEWRGQEHNRVMNDVRLPPRAEELVKCFVGIHERIDYYVVAGNEDLWITQLCAPTYEEVAALFEGASAYTHPDLIRLLYRDDRYEAIRDRNVRLVDALESHSPRAVVEELFKHLDKFTAEDRARSFLLLASELPTSVAEDAGEERTEWLDRIADSFEASPRALRLQLLLAASIVGHEPMVSLLLGDIAAGDELAPNIDAVEAECLIEAAMNQHYPIVKEFLAGGRFSTENETRWSAVVQALEVSCTNGSTDIAGILLPHYLSYCPVVSACGAHHPRLLRLALANWHFEIVELLLECDPRGTLCNMMGIIDALRAEVAQGFSGAASRSEVLSIVVGEEHDGVGDLVRWDAAALARGISSENTTLVRFLVNHIRLCREELEEALETAQAIGNLEVVEIISPRLQMSADPSEGIDSENEGMVASSPSIDSDSPSAEPDESQANTDQQSESDDSNQLELEKRSTARFDSSDGDSDNSVSVTDASPHMTCPRPTESLEALRTVSLEAVEQAISSARLFVVLKRIDIASDDLVQVSLENVGEPDCDDSLTDLQQFDTICSAEKLSWLRQYSRKTVDQILREGKLAATKQGVEASIDACNIDQTDAEDRSLPMIAVMNENGSGSVVIGCGQPTTQDETPLAESIHVEDCTIDCRALGILDQNGEEEWNHVGPGEIVIPVGIVDESLSAGDEAVSAESAETQAIVPETSGIVDSVVADAEGESEDFNCECVVAISTEMVENQFPESRDFVGDNECVIADDEHSKAILFDNNTSVEKASKEDDASERQVYEALTALMTQLPTVTPPSDPVDTTQNDVKDVGVNQDDDGLAEAESPTVAGYEHVDAGTHKTPCSKPLSMSICTSLQSPTRATIICPVKWIEHAINLPETSARAENYSPPLREGDRVQVRYEARSALFTGVIIYCHSNGAYDIVYEDGEEESCVPREYIQLVEPLQIGCHEDLQNANEQIGDAQTFPQDEPLDEPHLSSESSLGSASSDDTYQQQTHFENDSVTATCNSRNCEENLQEKGADFVDTQSSLMCSGKVADAETQLVDVFEVVVDSDSGLCLPRPNEENTFVQSCRMLKTRSHNECDNAVQGAAVSLNDLRPSLEVSEDEHPSLRLPHNQPPADSDLVVEHLPEIPSILVIPSTKSPASRKDRGIEAGATIRAPHRRLRERESSIISQRFRCRTADDTTSEELAEWKNVDQILSRKRRLFQSQVGSMESTKIPWGEAFASIQSLKRFATQHPDILRAHIETQLRELDGPLLSHSPRKSRSPRSRNTSAHSGAGQARDSLLLMKDLAFLLQQRLAPFFDAIVPVVIPTVFSVDKRFLCEIATEVLDAIILHCSGRKLALLFLQLGETYSKYEDLRLYNLTSVYVDKCVRNWSKSEVASLESSESSTVLLTLLAKSLLSKSAPVRISAQKSLRHLRNELGSRRFEDVVRAHLPQDLEVLVLTECRDASTGSTRSSIRRDASRRREAEKKTNTRSPTIVQSGPSILQRMLLQRQNRVLPTQT